MTQQGYQLVAENFGPIRRASIGVRPLTLLIGPNNSGKSYAAKLIYALSSAIASDGLFRVPRRDPWLDYLDGLDQSLPRRPWSELPEDQRSLYERSLRLFVDDLRNRIQWTSIEYFGSSDIKGLVNRHSINSPLLIEFGAEDPSTNPLKIRIATDAEDTTPELDLPSLDRAVLPVIDSGVLGGDQRAEAVAWRLGR